ncbi:hypothetical protein CPT03_04695 [Pedobacter ginsengisoli]|uniref:Uncharacterized protein n=1 Tax=Pedobacter ginsengisoli TaxID=363852 RepID=A0A2D1U2J1_9SPHI|nr:hypothetical protein CPT03_04695 [Pedobacter ginsengisoli]
MEFGLSPDWGKTRFSAYTIVAFSTMLKQTLYGPRSTRVEYVANQGGSRPEGSEPPKTMVGKGLVRKELL